MVPMTQVASSRSLAPRRRGELEWKWPSFLVVTVARLPRDKLGACVESWSIYEGNGVVLKFATLAGTVRGGSTTKTT